MQHPLTFIPNEKRKPFFFAFLALTLILFAVFRVLDAPLRTLAAPNGIVSFELAGSTAAAQSMINSWDARAELFAAFGLGIDYLFMPTYAWALSLGILLAAGRHAGAFAKVGAPLGWGAFAAALFDAVENYSLFQILSGNRFSPWPEIAFWNANAKFGLLLLGLVYALIGWLWPKNT